jgi:hypothetical protein
MLIRLLYLSEAYKEEHRSFSSYEIGLDVNVDKTKYMVMSRDQNAG